MKTHTTAYIFLSICLLSSLCAIRAENNIEYNVPVSGIYDRHAIMSSEKLFAAAVEADSVGDKNKAIALYSLIMGRANDKVSNSEKKICAKAADAVGIIYFGLYNFTKALKMFVLAQEICEDIGDKDYKISIGNNIGVLYSTFQDYTTAISYFEDFYENKQKNKQYKEAGYALNNIISSAIVARDTMAIGKYLEYTGLKCFENNDVVKYSNLIGNAFIASEKKEFETSLEYAKRSLSISNKIDSKELLTNRLLCFSCHYVGIAYLELKKYDSAMFYIRRSTAIAEKFGYKDVICVNYRHFANMAKERGLYKDYGTYMEQYVSVADSLYSIKEYGSLKDIVYGAKLEQTENEIYGLQDKQRTNGRMIRIQQMAIAGALLALVIISVFVVLLWRQKKELLESYLNLFQKNKEIMEAERAKEIEREIEREHERGQNQAKEQVAMQDVELEPIIAMERYSTSSLKSELKNTLISDILCIADKGDVFADPELTLETFSEMLDSNTKYVSQVINENFHKNFTTFINEYRVRAACRFFEDSEYKRYTIEAVGYKVGFKSRNNFNQAFKKHVGIPPSQYIKMCSNS